MSKTVDPDLEVGFGPIFHIEQARELYWHAIGHEFPSGPWTVAKADDYFTVVAVGDGDPEPLVMTSSEALATIIAAIPDILEFNSNLGSPVQGEE